MSDDLPLIDRGLLRRLDWARPAETSQAARPEPSPLATEALFDIGAVLEAVQATATSMGTMAERLRELEAHAEAFTTSNEALEAHNRQLTIALGEVVQQRDTLAANLEAETGRLRQLEGDTARHVARVSTLERNLGTAQADLAKIVDAVGSHFNKASDIATANVSGRVDTREG